MKLYPRSNVGTGTGQAANILSNSFEKVYGIDSSSIMLQNAIYKSNIQYLVGKAEDLSYFEDSSIDLLTVAGAFHWFDLKEFFLESFRVLKPNGTLAIWAYKYGIFKNAPIATKLSREFRMNTMGPYFEKGIYTVNNLYRDIKFPEELYQNVQWEICDEENNDDKNQHIVVNWTLSQYGNYLRTVSAYANYLEKHPDDKDPVDELISNMKKAEGWHDDELLPISFCSVLILAEKKS
ncbi:18242_t:CDS:2 [Cetraspora pellucida]|uniref:18242_t:CDS:1 n=1 Tax=Cetraspora pellucida TaxID=1433469 RepID=A0ACA9KLU7_9GLOM|nr:18242_t:CDS:2 [Cetraspora pellucida]